MSRFPPPDPIEPLPATTDEENAIVEQSQETAEAAPPISAGQLDPPEALARRLVEQLGSVPNGDLVAELITTSMKLLRDGTNRGDMKLVARSMKEIRYGLKVFAEYRDSHKISIFGSARTSADHPEYLAAAEFARRMVRAGWMVITGAGGGIMAAGHDGAGADPSFGLAIRLPFEQKTNAYIADNKKLINFKYFFTRKLLFVRSSSAIALFPGGFGTLDEGFEVLTLIQTGKSVPVPVVCVDQPGGTYWQRWLDYINGALGSRGFIDERDLRLFKVTSDLDEAVEEITRFYSNYHSLRYVRHDLVLRLHKAPSAAQLANLQRDHGHLLLPGGRFQVSGPLPPEADEPALNHLPRLVFPFNKRDNGGLRILIDDLNRL